MSRVFFFNGFFLIFKTETDPSLPALSLVGIIKKEQLKIIK